MPPPEPLAVLRLAGAGDFSEGLPQIARAPEEGRGFVFGATKLQAGKSSESDKPVFTGFGSCAKFPLAPVALRLR